MNFGIKSQLDTSMYNRGGSGTSIGEALGVAKGVLSMVDRGRERKAKQKDLEEEEAVNAAMSQSLAGWDRKDIGDFKNRVASGAGQLLTERPEAFSKVAPKIADAFKMYNDNEKARIDAEKGGLEITGKKLENEGKETANKSAIFDMNSKEIASKKADFDYQNGIENYVGYNLDDVKDQPSLDSFFQKMLAKRNITPEQLTSIPKTYQELEPIKKNVVDRFLSGEERRKKELDDFKVQQEQYGTKKAKSDADIAGINADYAKREKEAEVLKKEREANKPEPSAMDGIDPDTGKPYTQVQNKSAVFAVSMGRGIQNIDKLLEKGFNEADFVGQVLNTFRKKEKLSRFEFLNLAKTPEQRMYLQAQLDFMVPHLRDQSGAVINADEYTTEAAQFFPRPYETQPEVEQKRNARIQEFVARRTVGGSRYDQILKDYGTEMESRKKPSPEKYVTPPNVEDAKKKYGLTY